MDDRETALIPVSIESSTIGQVANQVARQTVLQDYQARKSQQTLRRQRADTALFEQFLTSAGHIAEGLTYDLQRWSFVTWGLVEAFNRWQLQQGYATGIEMRLAGIRICMSLRNRSRRLLPLREVVLEGFPFAL